MMITADTANKIIELMQKDSSYEEVLRKYFPSKEWRNEFRQHIYLHILEMDKDKLLGYWNSGQFKWIFCSMVKKEVASKTSYWYRQNRKWNLERINDDVDIWELNYSDDDTTEAEYEQIQKQYEDKVSLVLQTINELVKKDPHLIRDFNLFKLKFFQGMTFQQVADQTKVKKSNVFNYVTNAHKILLEEIKKQNKYL